MSISPRFRGFLLRKIGYKLYNSVSPEVRGLMLKDEISSFNQDIIRSGSRMSFMNEYVRSQGFNDYKAYQLDSLKKQGFNSSYEYETWLASEKGFKSRWDAYFSKVKKKGKFIRPIDLLDSRARKRGFASFSEYEDYLAQQRGFQNRADYRKFMRSRNSRGRN